MPQWPSLPELQNLGIHAATVVAHEESKLLRSVRQLDFDGTTHPRGGTRSPALSADPVDLVADRGVERSRFALDNHAIGRGLSDGEFLLDSGKCLAEILGRDCWTSVSRAQLDVLPR